jgi:hypothetical protein
VARRTKNPKIEKVQRAEVKLLSILRNGYFVKFDLNTIGKVNESRTRLWRAVVDQGLKDTIEHYLVEPDDVAYLDVVFWRNNDLGCVDVVCDLGSLNSVLVLQTFARIEQLCRELSNKGIRLT